MKVLVLGGGGREHALVRSLLADPEVSDVVAAPGNAGLAGDVETLPVEITDGAAVTRLAAELGIDLVVVGPEAPLVAGVADRVREAGMACFGPSAEAAQLEGSKAFAKQVMAAAGVPTAMSHVCESADEVAAALDAFGPPYVVKDDGLAAGKGVVVTDNRDSALAHALSCKRVIVEEFLDGPELSVFGITDGASVLPMQPAQDFKRVGDGDTGPNTGGMGAYSPLPWAPPKLLEEVQRTVLAPTVEEMRRRGTPFTGLLYAGLALTSRGLRVVEFNARFGDPEAQVVLARLRTSLGGLLHAAATGRLADQEPLAWRDVAAVTVVLAASGYPEAPRLGDPIEGLADVADPAYVLHAGTGRDGDGRFISTGGRILAVTATGPTLNDARHAAYEGIARVHVPGSHHRSDIAREAARGVGEPENR